MGVSSFYRTGSGDHAPNVPAGERTPLLGTSTGKHSGPADVTFDIPPKSGSEAKVPQDSKKGELPASLFKAMAKIYGFDLLKAHLCKLIYDLLQFVNPILL
ncbi:multidrug resistance-associated protein 1, partial [Elysia marginata]